MSKPLTVKQLVARLQKKWAAYRDAVISDAVEFSDEMRHPSKKRRDTIDNDTRTRHAQDAAMNYTYDAVEALFRAAEKLKRSRRR